MPRTTIYTDADDPDEMDNFPGCFASVGDAKELVIHDPSSGVETTYTAEEWVSVEIVNDDT